MYLKDGRLHRDRRFFIDGRWNADYQPPIGPEPKGFWQGTPARRKQYPMLRALYTLINMQPPNAKELARRLLAENYIFRKPGDDPEYDRKLSSLYRRIGRAKDQHIHGMKRVKKTSKKK